MLRPLFHLTVVAINSFVIWYDQIYIDLPFLVKEMENWPLQSRSMFLTFWCLILQTVYHFIAFLNDILGTNTQSPSKPPAIRRIKDALFALAFPTAVYVSIAFWSIYTIDKELIFPEHIERLYHPAINHVMHSTVTIFIFIELITSYQDYPSRKVGFAIILTFYVSYVVWYFIIYVKTGAWVYPVFQALTWPLRIIFISISLLVASGLYVLGENVNNYVCSNRKGIYTNGITNGKTKSKKKT